MSENLLRPQRILLANPSTLLTQDTGNPMDLEMSRRPFGSAISGDLSLLNGDAGNPISTKGEPMDGHVLPLWSFYGTVSCPTSKEESLKVDPPFDDMSVSLPYNLFGSEAAIFGEARRLDLRVSLTDDVFAIANQEASLAVFPVTCHESVVYSDCSKSPRLAVANVVFPEVNENTYRWRGDQGLLDRLSYPSSERIPENWSETLVDTKVIEMSPLAREPDSQPSEKRLIDEACHNWSQDVPLDNPVPHSQPLPSADSEDPPKKRRY